MRTQSLKISKTKWPRERILLKELIQSTWRHLGAGQAKIILNLHNLQVLDHRQPNLNSTAWVHQEWSIFPVVNKRHFLIFGIFGLLKLGRKFFRWHSPSRWSHASTLPLKRAHKFQKQKILKSQNHVEEKAYSRSIQALLHVHNNWFAKSPDIPGTRAANRGTLTLGASGGSWVWSPGAVAPVEKINDLQLTGAEAGSGPCALYFPLSSTNIFQLPSSTTFICDGSCTRTCPSPFRLLPKHAVRIALI